MKVRIELVDGLPEDEVVIRCAGLSEEVAELEKTLRRKAGQNRQMVFYKEGQEYYFSPAEVLFFETENEVVYAHTQREAYQCRHRLYELEELLPKAFVRVSKSTIVNTGKIYSIKRDLTGANQVQFEGTHKSIYASRRFYAALKQRMRERSEYE